MGDSCNTALLAGRKGRNYTMTALLAEIQGDSCTTELLARKEGRGYTMTALLVGIEGGSYTIAALLAAARLRCWPG